MTVHVISTAAIPTPPPEKGYGGIELLVYYLVRELEKKYKVRLYALDGSYVPNGGLVTGNTEYELATKVSEISDGDVVIDWSHTKPFSSIGKDVPTYSQVFWTDSLGRNPVFPSKAVARAYGYCDPVIYPGINIDEYPYVTEKEDYLLYFGRIIPEKGVERVIALANMTNSRLIVAGHTGTFSYNKEYVEQIKAACKGKHEFIADPDQKTKIDLLSHAKAVVHLPRWLESFWIVGCEALACGTPIITYVGSGGPEELVKISQGGIIAYRDDLLSAVSLVQHIPPKVCREGVSYFSSERMGKEWCNLIEVRK
ncbi:MAG: glycosyltransferase [Thaumarchaeota archaeon]|nr:glycosyltransferase [Candidatus Calditenuaceae archaeon]